LKTFVASRHLAKEGWVEEARWKVEQRGAGRKEVEGRMEMEKEKRTAENRREGDGCLLWTLIFYS